MYNAQKAWWKPEPEVIIPMEKKACMKASDGPVAEYNDPTQDIEVQNQGAFCSEPHDTPSEEVNVCEGPRQSVRKRPTIPFKRRKELVALALAMAETIHNKSASHERHFLFNTIESLIEGR